MDFFEERFNTHTMENNAQYPMPEQPFGKLIAAIVTILVIAAWMYYS